MRRIKVMKISTHQNGGAYIAAERQRKAVLRHGVIAESLSVSDDFTEVSKDPRIQSSARSVHTVHGLARQRTLPEAAFHAISSGSRIPISNTYISIWAVEGPYDHVIADFLSKRGTDIVHFHWSAGLISTRLLRLLAESGIRTVLTLHDMNYFTGVCHYSAGCSQYSTACRNCEQLQASLHQLVEASFEAKCDALSRYIDLMLFPSNWLLGEFKSSFLSSKTPPDISSLQHNCVDTTVFQPLCKKGKTLNRSLRLGIPNNGALNIVAGSLNNNEMRKGFSDLECVLQQMTAQLRVSDQNVNIITVGPNARTLDVCLQRFQQIDLGVIEESAVRDLFQAADLLLFPSREDNLPNMVLEAIACGCPVVAYNSGGIADLIIDGKNGMLAEKMEPSHLAIVMKALVDPLRLSHLKEATAEWSDKNRWRFGFENTGAMLARHYRQVLQ